METGATRQEAGEIRGAFDGDAAAVTPPSRDAVLQRICEEPKVHEIYSLLGVLIGRVRPPDGIDEAAIETTRFILHLLARPEKWPDTPRKIELEPRRKRVSRWRHWAAKKVRTWRDL